MKTRDVINMSTPNIRLATLLITLISVAACDAAEERYGHKNYGIGSDDAEGGNGSNEDIIIENSDGDGDSADARPTTAPTGTDGDSSEDGGETNISDDGSDQGDQDGGEVAPDTLIKDDIYRARFDLDSVRGLNNQSGYKSLSGLVAGRIKEQLTTTRDDGIRIAQTFGDGEARSSTRQRLRNTAGDRNRAANAPSASGLRTMDRIVTATCPGVFVCSERMTVAPDAGPGMTVCFTDTSTGERVPFPFGAAPNYKEADFDQAYGTYGPYTVAAFAGNTVDCSAPPTTPLAAEEVTVKVAKASVAGMSFPLRTVAPALTPSYAVSFTIARTAGDTTAPYVDETVLLNRRSVYVIDAARASLAKLVVSTRMSVDIASQAGGGLFGSLAALLANIDGIEVDLHFEQCRDALDPADVDHCP